MANNLHIIYDTNVLEKNSNTDYSNFVLSENFVNVYEFIKWNKIDNVKLYTPKICIEEIISHYCKNYRNSKKTAEDHSIDLQDMAKCFGWEIIIDKTKDITVKEYLKEIKEQSTILIENLNNFVVIPHCNNDKLPKIIDRAIKKKLPFFGGGGGSKEYSDAGFKDVVFLESIKEFFIDSKDELWILSNDKNLREINMLIEFNGKTAEFKCCDNGNNFIKILCEKLDVIDFTQQYKFCHDPYYSQRIEKELGCKVLNPVVNIKEITGDYTCYEIETEIDYGDGDGTKNVLVRITKDNEFDEILDKITGEVIATW